jgi:hypothetical protein
MSLSSLMVHSVAGSADGVGMGSSGVVGPGVDEGSAVVGPGADEESVIIGVSLRAVSNWTKNRLRHQSPVAFQLFLPMNKFRHSSCQGCQLRFVNLNRFYILLWKWL